MRFVVAAGVCAVFVAAAGLGLVARAALTDTTPRTRIQTDVRGVEHAQAVDAALSASVAEVRDLVALNAFGTAPWSITRFVPDATALSSSTRGRLVTELVEARHVVGGVSSQLSIPVSVQRSLAIASSDAREDNGLRAGTVRLDPRPYGEVLDWFTSEDASAQSERAKALNDLVHVPAATSPVGARRIVGVALISAFMSISLVLFAAWRRSRRFEHRSSRDVLTDLANRRQLDHDVTAHANDRVAVLMIDIDHFKQLNDTLGHAAGDHALVCVAHCIGLTVRSGDLAYRYGGEEFCVLLPETDLPTATTVAERIRSAVEDLDIEGSERLPNGRVTVSIGVALDTPEPGMNAADRALYAAKNSGRNRIKTAAEAVNA
jgi:diguanylate cyclase (GGDEF)-like protein